MGQQDDWDTESNLEAFVYWISTKFLVFLRHIKPAFIQVIALAGLGIFLLFLMSSTVQLVHNNPSNVFDGKVTQLGGNQTSINNTSLGLTYDVRNEFLIKQIDGPIVFVPLLNGLVLPITIYVTILWVLYKVVGYFENCRDGDSSIIHEIRPILGIIAAVIGMVAYHVIITAFIFEVSLPIYHITDPPGGTVPFTLGLLLDGQANIFRRLLLIQGIVIGFIVAVWTRNVGPSGNEKIHLNNWRQYGSWISTVLGGVLITTGFVFVTNLTAYGNMFVRQILILFGGALILSMSFVVYKMNHLEGVID